VEGAGVVDGACGAGIGVEGADVGGACAAGGAGFGPRLRESETRDQPRREQGHAKRAPRCFTRFAMTRRTINRSTSTNSAAPRMPATIRCCGLTDVAIASWSRRLRTPKKLDQTATTICKKLADEAGAEGWGAVVGMRFCGHRKADRKSRGGAGVAARRASDPLPIDGSTRHRRGPDVASAGVAAAYIAVQATDAFNPRRQTTRRTTASTASSRAPTSCAQEEPRRPESAPEPAAPARTKVGTCRRRITG